MKKAMILLAVFLFAISSIAKEVGTKVEKHEDKELTQARADYQNQLFAVTNPIVEKYNGDYNNAPCQKELREVAYPLRFKYVETLRELRKKLVQKGDNKSVQIIDNEIKSLTWEEQAEKAKKAEEVTRK